MTIPLTTPWLKGDTPINTIPSCNVPMKSRSTDNNCGNHIELPTLGNFDVHAEMDIVHSRMERELLERHLDSEDHEAIATNVWRVLDRLWELLSGVCQRHSIA